MATMIDENALRITPAELKKHMDTWQPVTILDARGEEAYQDSDKKIRGDQRIDPGHFEVDRRWPKNQLTVVYCT